MHNYLINNDNNNNKDLYWCTQKQHIKYNTNKI